MSCFIFLKLSFLRKSDFHKTGVYDTQQKYSIVEIYYKTTACFLITELCAVQFVYPLTSLTHCFSGYVDLAIWSIGESIQQAIFRTGSFQFPSGTHETNLGDHQFGDQFRK